MPVATHDAIRFSCNRAFQNPIVIRIVSNDLQTEAGVNQGNDAFQFRANEPQVFAGDSKFSAQRVVQLVQKRRR